MAIKAANAATAPMFIFSFNEGFVPLALKGLSHEELWRSLTDRNNSILWVAGHLAQSRADVLNMLGRHFETGWGNLFARGARVGDPSLYPSEAEVERVMREISQQMCSVLPALKDDELTRAAALPVPGVETLGDELAFFALHDSYHVGQMAYIRKGLGYPGIAG